MATSIDGLVTGLDTTKLIEGLLSVHRSRVALLEGNRDKFVEQQAAFKGVEARLLTFQGVASRLGRSQNGAFDARKAESSDPTLLSAAVSTSATPGVYSVRINSLARGHQIATQGFDDPNSAITQGTILIKVGSGATTTITIDGTNGTLAGLAGAINNSGAGVTATIINDGSDGRTQPNRLLLTANKTGAENAIAITNNLAADAGGARRPELAANYIGAAVTGAGFTGTAAPTANSGAGGYTGSANNSYKFTVSTGGTVGTDNGIQLAFTDSSGANSGTITLNSSDADVFKTVAQGIQVKLSAGTLVAGDSFTIDAFVPTVQQAANASITLGSGSGALAVQSATNQIDGVIGGVTLNLLGADGTKDLSVTVANDTEKARDDILEFIETFNDLMEFIDDQVRYDAETKQAGTLLGNRSASVIQEEVRRTMTDVVAGASPLMNRLGALGVTTNDQGRLELNQAKLDDALSGRITGVTLADVRRLFALTGQSSSGGVQFVTGSTKTKASGSVAYQVDLSQAARQATITATNPLAASTSITAANNTLTITVDGKSSSTITLASGTYTRLGLAQELQAQINANGELAGRPVAVSLSGNQLVVTSNAYGLASEVAVGAGTALAPLGFAGTESNKGQDVVGKFIVNGVDEAAVGTGQFLAGSPGNANTADLQVRVTLSTAQIAVGPEAAVTVTRGIASKLDVVLNGLLDPVSGRLESIEDGLQDNVDDSKKAIDRQTQFLKARQESLQRQFVALERAVSELRGTGDFLAAQLAATATSRRGTAR